MLSRFESWWVDHERVGKMTKTKNKKRKCTKITEDGNFLYIDGKVILEKRAGGKLVSKEVIDPAIILALAVKSLDKMPKL